MNVRRDNQIQENNVRDINVIDWPYPRPRNKEANERNRCIFHGEGSRLQLLSAVRLTEAMELRYSCAERRNLHMLLYCSSCVTVKLRPGPVSSKSIVAVKPQRIVRACEVCSVYAVEAPMQDAGHNAMKHL